MDTYIYTTHTSSRRLRRANSLVRVPQTLGLVPDYYFNIHALLEVCMNAGGTREYIYTYQRVYIYESIYDI